MRIDFHRQFEKQFARLAASEKLRARKRFLLFSQNPRSPILRNHALKGKFIGYHSINIGGDTRAIFKIKTATHVEFVTIGTHSQLYK